MACRFSILGNHRHLSKSEAKRMIASGHYRLEGRRTLVPITPAEKIAHKLSQPQFSYIPATLPQAELPGLKFQRPASAKDVLGHVYFRRLNPISSQT